MSRTIEIVERDHPLINSALALVERESVASWAILFGGDRWHPVEYIALALEDGQPIGLATLAPTDEMGVSGPHIIGIWVKKHYRRQDIGRQLLEVLATKSLEVYGKQATVIGVTLDGSALLHAAGDLPIIGKRAGFGNLE